MVQPYYSIQRDRLGLRLAELSRILEDPTRVNIELVKQELYRLGRG